MRCAVYARISRDEDDQRAGVDRQLVRGAEVAEGNGWTVVDTFTDNDLSAFNGDERPGFEALRKSIEAHRIEAVIVQHQDRIARNVSTFRDFADLCRSHDVRLETWTGPVDTSSATGRFTSTVQAATDEHYSALISEKARSAHAEIAARGEPNGGRRPFGYERTTLVDDKGKTRRTFAPLPDEAPIVADCFQRFTNGESIRSLALGLKAKGLRTAGGAEWSPARLRDVLRNPLYIGQRVHKGTRTEGNWPALVDRATFETAQAMLTGRTRPPGYNVRRYYLAGGLTLCGRCGSPLVARPQRGKRRYGCNPDGAGCGRIGIQAEPLEEHIGALILAVLSDPRIIEAVGKHRDTDNTGTLAELDVVEARRVELAEAFAMGEIDRSQLAAATVALDRQRDGLRSQLVQPSNGLGAEDLRDLWESERVDWKNRVASTLIESIVIAPGVPGRSVYDPERVKVNWRAS